MCFMLARQVARPGHSAQSALTVSADSQPPTSRAIHRPITEPPDDFSRSPARPVPAAYRLPRRGGCSCPRHDLGRRRLRQRRLDRRWHRRRRRGRPGRQRHAQLGVGAAPVLDPVTSSAGWDMHALGLVYASVTTLDTKGSVQAGLASGWKYAANGKSVTFTPRPGLKFSNGAPLTATSVEQNIQRGQTQSNSTVVSELSVISKVVVNSPTSFTLDLAQVDYQVPDLLAGKDGMIVNPAYFKTVKSLATQPEGAGPFSLTAYVPDSHASLVRNPDYWDASQIHLQNFNVLDITQPEQILSSLESGQVNVAYIAGNQVAAAKAAGFKIDVIPSEVVDELDLQTTTAPFNNPDVVKALNYGIDRQAILQVQASGYGAVAFQPFPAGFVGYSSKLANEYPYNP